MNKKFISAMLSLGIIASTTAVFADTIGEVTSGTSIPTLMGATSGTDVVFNDVDGSTLILNGYNNDGELVYSTTQAVTDKTVTLSNEILNYELRAYIPGSDTVRNVSIGTGESPAPTSAPTASPAPTEEPEETPKITPTPGPYNPNEFPAVYEKAINAYYAFAVIEDVSTEAYESEIGTRVKYYYQGEECSDWLSDEVEILSSPDTNPELTGAKLTSLKRGDVVFFNRRMNGTIKEIAVIYRPAKSDIVTSTEDYGPNFEKLFTYNGVVTGYSQWKVQPYGTRANSNGTYYAFGLVGKRDKTTLYLLNKSGKVDNTIELAMSDDTPVYICDMELTKGIETSKSTAIASCVPNSMWNNAEASDTKAIDLSEVSHDYALARIVDGTVMDIVVYTNY